VFGVAGQGALSDFEDETTKRKVGLFGGGSDVFRKREIGELSKGDIDGECEVLGDVLGIGEDSAEKIPREKTIEAVSFGEGDEIIGTDKTTKGVLPAGEDLEAAEESGPELDERLEIGDDLVLFKSSA
jgi:hypothetical protein